MQAVDDGAQMAKIEQQAQAEENSGDLMVFLDRERTPAALLYSSSSLTPANISSHRRGISPLCWQRAVSQGPTGGLGQPSIVTEREVPG